jgi:uncharacterized protein
MVRRDISGAGLPCERLTRLARHSLKYPALCRAFALLQCEKALRNLVAGAIAGTFLALLSPPAYAQPGDFSANARLLTSARNDDAAGIERALRDGAAVDSRNRLGESALIIALKRNRPDLARVLIAAGANVNQPAINGVTPLMAAAYAGEVEIARSLLDKGADPAALDRLQKNAMTYAAGGGRTEVVRLLLAHGVDPNAIYRNELTALMWAAGNGHTATVEALLAAGARPELKDNRGKTALDIAREQGHADAVAALERAVRSERSAADR